MALNLPSLLTRLRMTAQAGGRPPAAVELSAAGVLAATQSSASEPVTWAFRPLAAGCLTPSISEPNLVNSQAVAATLREALDQVNPSTRSITVVVPDTVVRVFVLDFDSLPSRAADALPILHFRLRKTVPFDAEHAALSYQILTQQRHEVRVLAAVMPSAVLAEYESAVREAGYEPGAVLSSSLAALSAVEPSEPSLVVNLGSSAMTTAIVSGSDLLLYRTLDLPDDDYSRREEICRGVAVAGAFFEDKIGVPPSRLLFAGAGPEAAQQFADLLATPGLDVVELAPRPESGALTPAGSASFAAVTGALTRPTGAARIQSLAGAA